MRQIVSTLLILIIVYSTIGIRVNEHYCEVSNTTSHSYFKVEKDCCPSQENSCPFHKKKKDCCKDEVSLVHLDQDIHYQPESIDADFYFSTVTPFLLEYKNIISSTFESKKTKGRAPPLIHQEKNTQSFLQVYII